MSLRLTTPPAMEPVTLNEMKLQCGLSPFEDTDLLREQTLAEQLRSAVTAARSSLEEELGLAFITQSWTMALDRFPHAGIEYLARDRFDIVLPRPALQGLASFVYLDTGGIAQNMMLAGSWGYQITGAGGNQPARIRPHAGFAWPPTQYGATDAVVIGFTCGFGDTAASVPMPIRNAIKLRAKWLYGGAVGSEPVAVRMLTGSWQDLNI